MTGRSGKIKVYNSLTKKLEPFVPLRDEVGIYVCGVTPYDYIHLGHARTYIAFDIIIRYLRYKGYKVRYVQNITDIDDKIIKRARDEKRDPLELSKTFSEMALEDMDQLKIKRADFYPKVSGHIPEIISLIERLIDKGYAYVSQGSVYYDVSKFADYGKLSGQKLDEIKAGARVEPGEDKRSPEDFALWKKAKEGEISFDSPWGRGRPGWHIECSAMSMKYLGETFDIHGGGRDLIFPHHENEIAQSEAATGKQFVRYWMHTGFLTVNGEKMAKSLNNFITVRDALREHDPEAIRLFFALTHYRSPIDYSVSSLRQANNSLQTLYNTLENSKAALRHAHEGKRDTDFERDISNEKKKFIAAMDNDFNTPLALSSVFAVSKKINQYITGEVCRESLEMAVVTLKEMCGIFGILENDGKKARLKEGINEELLKLILELRKLARENKDYETSDMIRARLKELGITLEDKSDGSTEWKIG